MKKVFDSIAAKMLEYQSHEIELQNSIGTLLSARCLSRLMGGTSEGYGRDLGEIMSIPHIPKPL